MLLFLFLTNQVYMSLATDFIEDTQFNAIYRARVTQRSISLDSVPIDANILFTCEVTDNIAYAVTNAGEDLMLVVSSDQETLEFDISNLPAGIEEICPIVDCCYARLSNGMLVQMFPDGNVHMQSATQDIRLEPDDGLLRMCRIRKFAVMMYQSGRIMIEGPLSNSQVIRSGVLDFPINENHKLSCASSGELMVYSDQEMWIVNLDDDLEIYEFEPVHDNIIAEDEVDLTPTIALFDGHDIVMINQDLTALVLEKAGHEWVVTNTFPDVTDMSCVWYQTKDSTWETTIILIMNDGSLLSLGLPLDRQNYNIGQGIGNVD